MPDRWISLDVVFLGPSLLSQVRGQAGAFSAHIFITLSYFFLSSYSHFIYNIVHYFHSSRFFLCSWQSILSWVKNYLLLVICFYQSTSHTHFLLIHEVILLTRQCQLCNEYVPTYLYHLQERGTATTLITTEDLMIHITLATDNILPPVATMECTPSTSQGHQVPQRRHIRSMTC